ncbi:MAG TPA: hypothetical protein VM186_10440 [Planctomycetota bacterium]|nr:hypothetical protein [Planctomycetota bacterium]
MDRIAYGGWDNCYRLANRSIELIVTGDVGPRVIRLAPKNGQNLFKEFASMMGKTGGDEWRICGGHRLWHSPEAKPRTYFPDNLPVQISEIKNGLRTLQMVETTTGIQKQMEITLDPAKPHVKVVHRLTNRTLWPVKLAPWALSVMAPGGVAIIPQAPYSSHEESLLPARPIVLWPYTNMADKRWTWGQRYIQLRQDTKARKPQKVGLALQDGWAAYALKGTLFLKRFAHVANVEYPDFGCSFETFTNADMLEVESVGPLATLEPGKAVQHVEHWFVFENVKIGKTDAAIEKAIVRLIEQSGKMMK